MKSEIDMNTVTLALSDILNTLFPDATTYANPTQQDASLPAWYINFVPNVSIDKRMGNRWMRTLRVDLVYLEDYNLTNLYDRYKNAADILDEHLELFDYVDDAGTVYKLRTYERQWRVSLADLHYEFKLQIYVSKTKPPVPTMETIESLDMTALEGGLADGQR